MKIIDGGLLTQTIKEMAVQACCHMDENMLIALKEARSNEEGAARFAIDTLVENCDAAKRHGIPICQDTGMAIVFIEAGNEVHFDCDVNLCVNEGVRQAYKEGLCRMSVLDPLTRKNTGDNTPAIIHYEVTQGEDVKITFLPKGFGSENMSKLYMLTPAEGIEGVKNKVLEAVKVAGANPCPPIIVGVGIGGTGDYAMLLSKYALLRPLDQKNPDPTLALLEEELLLKINDLGIGPQGFGGKTTAIKVHINKYPTHLAALPVGISIQCNAHRISVRQL